MKPEPLTLIELKALEELNEYDVLYKLIELTSSKELRKRVEQILRGNGQAGIDVRRNLQDVKLLSNVIRDKIQIRKGVEWKDDKEDSLAKAIREEAERIRKAEEKAREAEMEAESQ